MYKNLILFSIIILTILSQIRSYYNYFLNTYFREGDSIIYDYLIDCIHCVSKNNYFMNYGLWDKNNNTLKKANQNLCNFIFEKANLNSIDKFSILDVGCGYGKQDFLLHSKLSQSSKIIGLDLSKKQVEFANKFRKKKNINKKQLVFLEGDAHFLMDYFTSNCKFNRIFSIESAFHYKDRSLFFNNVRNLLKKDGLFVISDIILKDDFEPSFINNFFINIASDFLCIPEQNLIKLNKWKNQFQNSYLEIVELHDITDKTFVPYYEFFFENYIRNKKLPNFMADILIYIFNNIQPFSYVVAVCKPRINNFNHFSIHNNVKYSI
jgi:cyclopropane fatty-acyl-phospholipid synthase-like methyltransferase